MMTRSRKCDERRALVTATVAALRRTGIFPERYLIQVEFVRDRSGLDCGLKLRPPKQRQKKKTRPGLVRVRLEESWLEKVYARGATMPLNRAEWLILHRQDIAIPEGFDDAAKFIVTGPRGGGTWDRAGVRYAGEWFLALTLYDAAAIARQEIAGRLNIDIAIEKR
jgi:hypothetical protein